MKETKELLAALFQTVNAIALASKDGKLGTDDIAMLIPLIFAWQEAVKDLRFAGEAANAKPADIDNLFSDTDGQLSALHPETRYGIVTLTKGAYVGYWLGTKKGFEAGFKAAVTQNQLKNK